MLSQRTIPRLDRHKLPDVQRFEVSVIPNNLDLIEPINVRLE